MDFSDLYRLASGHAEARIVQTAVSLGVFGIIENGASEAPAVAASIKADPRATGLLLNAMVALGLLRKENSRFSLTDLSATYLTRSSPKFFGEMILFDASLWDCWGDFEKAV